MFVAGCAGERPALDNYAAWCYCQAALLIRTRRFRRVAGKTPRVFITSDGLRSAVRTALPLTERPGREDSEKEVMVAGAVEEP